MRPIFSPAQSGQESWVRAFYRPLVEACRDQGISRSVAFELARKGLLDTFAIGKRRYVFLESLRTLPERLAAQEGAQ